MMIPSSGTPVSLTDLLHAFLNFRSGIGHFERALKDFLGVKHLFLVNSGTTAFYLILKALKAHSRGEEVILPAYTAPSLLLPVWKAGLRPVLCEVSLKTFNLDPARLEEVFSPATLCVLAVHMFGIPCCIEEILEITRRKEIIVVDDAASAFGSRLSGTPVGTLGDVGFYSFNRGKNLSTLAGGCIVTNNDEIASTLQKEVNQLEEVTSRLTLQIMLKTMALALAVRPPVYTAFHQLISRWKYTTLHTDFDSYRYTDFQARLGATLLEHGEKIFQARYTHGLFLAHALDKADGIALPTLESDWFPVFNQFPLLLKDREVRDQLHRYLKEFGVEVTTLYPDPLHRTYDLGYNLKKDPFPQATALAERLLLIPTHPLISQEKLGEIANATLNFL
ncbi:MAG: DegT/DnrJ/EryC1/StrS family aminotransferase [Candidatus Tectomicrobia bacterium]|nr:DegT/DnrJ/EryC1/StrS family aminotransferase [Candidatus Tectomicrobia bacterium]